MSRHQIYSWAISENEQSLPIHRIHFALRALRRTGCQPFYDLVAEMRHQEGWIIGRIAFDAAAVMQNIRVNYALAIPDFVSIVLSKANKLNRR